MALPFSKTLHPLKLTILLQLLETCAAFEALHASDDGRISYAHRGTETSPGRFLGYVYYTARDLWLDMGLKRSEWDRLERLEMGFTRGSMLIAYIDQIPLRRAEDYANEQEKALPRGGWSIRVVQHGALNTGATLVMELCREDEEGGRRWPVLSALWDEAEHHWMTVSRAAFEEAVVRYIKLFHAAEAGHRPGDSYRSPQEPGYPDEPTSKEQVDASTWSGHARKHLAP